MHAHARDLRSKLSIGGSNKDCFFFCFLFIREVTVCKDGGVSPEEGENG